jgi:hypothetical protein
MNRKAQHMQQVVMRVLRLSEEQYGTHVLEEGMRYLDLHMGTDRHGKAGRDALVAMPEYWAWWTRQWHLRNETFVKEQELETWGQSTGKWERVLLMRVYMEMHAADRLQMEVPKRVLRPAIKALRNA